MTSRVFIQKEDGELLSQSRAVLRDTFAELPNGAWSLTFQEERRNYTPTRYKYYFAHVLETILLTCGKRFEVLDGDTFRPARNTDEIHAALKMKYNPIIVRTPFGTFTVPASTTGLSDSEFINQFEETIIAEFSAPPFGCDFMTREDWAVWMKEKKHPFPS